MTKALGGHGDAIGGAVCGNDEALVLRARDTIVKGFGGVMSPLTAYLVARGITTFALRQRLACSTAARLAKMLAAHPSIAKVHHPSLDPDRAKHMHAFGSLLLRLSSSRRRMRFGAMRGAFSEHVKLITHAVSLGDARSLLTQPATTTHSTMPPRRQNFAQTSRTVCCGVSASASRSAVDLERDLVAALSDRT